MAQKLFLLKAPNIQYVEINFITKRLEAYDNSVFYLTSSYAHVLIDSDYYTNKFRCVVK